MVECCASIHLICYFTYTYFHCRFCETKSKKKKEKRKNNERNSTTKTEEEKIR